VCVILKRKESKMGEIPLDFLALCQDIQRAHTESLKESVITSTGEKRNETFSGFITPPAFKMSHVIKINVYV
jgi:hypothetical protein